MRRLVFGVGAAELLVTARADRRRPVADRAWPLQPRALAGLALAMSSTALVLPISGTHSPVGRAALAMLLFEDLALVPIIFLLGAAWRRGGRAASADVAIEGALVIVAMLVVGRFLLPRLFAQAARTKSPELFLAVSLLVVIVAGLATAPSACRRSSAR